MRAFLIAVMLLYAASARGEWSRIGSIPGDGSGVYLDVATVRRNGQLRRAWALLDHKVEQRLESGARYRSDKIQYEYDCKGERTRVLAGITYSDQMGEGKPVDSATAENSRWEPVAPGTVAELLWKRVCEPQR
jgi:hypothetical protein